MLLAKSHGGLLVTLSLATGPPCVLHACMYMRNVSARIKDCHRLHHFVQKGYYGLSAYGHITHVYLRVAFMQHAWWSYI